MTEVRKARRIQQSGKCALCFLTQNPNSSTSTLTD